jgi:Rieske Fe-S protein
MATSEQSGDASMQANWDAWLEEIQAIGGSNPLRNFEPNTFGQIDLERSHPGGYSQFITGRPTLLSNLVRDPLAYSRSLTASRRIKQKAQRLGANFGLSSIYLAGGLADFKADDIDLAVPILLWPVQLLERGDDYEFEISGDPFVNPELLAALKRHFDLTINSTELLARQLEASDLVPITLLNYLAYATNAKRTVRDEFLVVVGNCTHLGCLPKARFEQAQPELGADWPGGFFCPCHGSRFDLAGRVFQGSPASVNLRIPPYSFSSDSLLVIGKDDSVQGAA